MPLDPAALDYQFGPLDKRCWRLSLKLTMEDARISGMVLGVRLVLCAVWIIVFSENAQTAEKIPSEFANKTIATPWKPAKGKVDLLCSGRIEKLTAHEASYTVYAYMSPVSTIALSRPNGDVVWIGPKSDLYVETTKGIFGLKLAREGSPGIGWFTNSAALGKRLNSVVNYFETNVDGKGILYPFAWTAFWPPLFDDFFTHERLGATALGKVDVTLMHAALWGRDLELRIKGVEKPIASLTIDVETRQVIKGTMNGKDLKIERPPD
jgi:hypothetical protein